MSLVHNILRWFRIHHLLCKVFSHHWVYKDCYTQDGDLICNRQECIFCKQERSV